MMKKIGLIGGITWHSTIEYYREINLETSRRRGKLHSAALAIESLDFEEIARLGAQDREEEVYLRFLHAGQALKRSGAEVIAMCANTAHRRADRIEKELAVQLVHIGDAIGKAVHAAGLSSVGLLGTARTMAEPFLKERLRQKHRLNVLVPNETGRAEIDRYIFEEMAAGVFSEEARGAVGVACDQLISQGAQGVILGCTELPILMRGVALPIPTFDTTRLHAASIVEAALMEED